MGAFMAILHPRAGRQMASNGVARSRGPACTTVWEVTPLRTPTNGLLRAAGFEPRCGARSERTLPTQLSLQWQLIIKFEEPIILTHTNKKCL